MIMDYVCDVLTNVLQNAANPPPHPALNPSICVHFKKVISHRISDIGASTTSVRRKWEFLLRRKTEMFHFDSCTVVKNKTKGRRDSLLYRLRAEILRVYLF